MATISAETVSRVARILPRLASDHDGEVVATARALVRTLAADNATMLDVAAHLVRSTSAPVAWDVSDIKRPTPAKSPAPAPAAPPEPALKPLPTGPLTREEVAAFVSRLGMKTRRRRSDAGFVERMSQTAARTQFRFDPSPSDVERWRALLVKHFLVLKPKKGAASSARGARQ